MKIFTVATVIATILVVATSFVVEAEPGQHSTTPRGNVGLGDTCNNSDRQCRDHRTCTRIPGRDKPVCVDLVQPGGRCTAEYAVCTKGYHCDIPHGQYQGLCKPASSHYRRSWNDQQVGLGDTCDNHSRKCRDHRTCTRIPGRSQPVCVDLVQPGGKCTAEYAVCTKGYRCDIPHGQYQGLCKPASSHYRRSWNVEYVGLGDTCNNQNRLCRDHRTCTHIPGRSQPVCVDLVQPGGKCTAEYAVCTKGYHCDIPHGQYQGKCKSIY